MRHRGNREHQLPTTSYQLPIPEFRFAGNVNVSSQANFNGFFIDATDNLGNRGITQFWVTYDHEEKAPSAPVSGPWSLVSGRLCWPPFAVSKPTRLWLARFLLREF